MADTIDRYNSTLKRLWNGEVNKATLRVMLLDNTAVFTATNTTLAQVAGAGNAKQLSGNGWTAGGETLANVIMIIVNTSGVMFDADDVRKTATGGPIPPAAAAYKAALYDDSDANDAPLFFITFDSPRQAGEAVDFLISWAANGIAQNAWI